jgi:hypothetical protein
VSVIDGFPIVNLDDAIDSLRAPQIPKPVLRPVPNPLPIQPAVVTTITRSGTTIGVVITPFNQPAPTAANVKLDSGTSWVEATLFGAAFSSTPGFAGVPFSGANINAAGSVTLWAGSMCPGCRPGAELQRYAGDNARDRAARCSIGPDFARYHALEPSGASVAPLEPARRCSMGRRWRSIQLLVQPLCC